MMDIRVLSIILLISVAYGWPVNDSENGTNETTETVETTTIQIDTKDGTFDSLPTCKRSDPNLNECIKNATITLKNKIAEGIPELQLRSIDPLKIPTVKLEQTTSRLDYKGVLMDVTLYGLKDYEFCDVDADLENLTISAKINFNHVYLDAEYMLMGIFESLPVEGSGKMLVNFTDPTITVFMQGGLLKKKDKVHFMTQDTDAFIELGKSTIKFENLNTGAGDRSQISQHMVNYHLDELLDELKPGIETIVGMLFDDVANKFFKNLPFDKLFPE